MCSRRLHISQTHKKLSPHSGVINMSQDEDLYNQPTEPRMRVGQSSSTPSMGQVITSTPQAAPVPPPPPVHRRRRMSRRTLIGASLAGLAGLGIGGIALGEYVQHSGLSNLFHGPMASDSQIGHLLRRAGFGATPGELTTYKNLGFSGAVDRLLNYQQVSDDATDNRLKALNLNLARPLDQQRWWLLRMAWTQRPLLEKMTLFWHGEIGRASC